jgi:RNA polymerase sigma-70 factor (ECF subfamily)
MMSSWAQPGTLPARALLHLARSPLAMTAPGRPGTGPLETDERPAPSTLSTESATRFRGLVDGHFNFIWRYLRGLGVPEANVDDAAQQVFLVAAQKIDSVVVGSERSFLVGTALGVAANARRAYARRQEVPDGALVARMDEAPSPEERTEAKQGLAVLDQFLHSLPEELRVVFILFELEGLTMSAIAETLSLPPGTVASRLRRAREDFQAMAKRFQAGMSRRPS